jgi:pilus assembly protein CpaB
VTRFLPAPPFSGTSDVAGLKAAVAISAGTDLTHPLVADPAEIASAAIPVGPGERVAELVAMGSPAHVVRGSRVDVLVTRDTADQEGETTLALEDAEVLNGPGARGGARRRPRPARRAVAPCPPARGRLPRRGAVLARELRGLPRAEGDRRRGAAGLRVGSGL